LPYQLYGGIAGDKVNLFIAHDLNLWFTTDLARDVISKTMTASNNSISEN